MRGWVKSFSRAKGASLAIRSGVKAATPARPSTASAIGRGGQCWRGAWRIRRRISGAGSRIRNWSSPARPMSPQPLNPVEAAHLVAYLETLR